MTTHDEATAQPPNRREFLTRLGAAGLGVAAGSILAGCGGGSNSSGGSAVAQTPNNDAAILGAAATAEALATTMYYNIINTPNGIFNTGPQNISGNAADKAYLVAGYEQELNHYQTLATFAPSVTMATNFYFPTGMFTNAQMTINTLVTLEDAFIAAYLIGVQQFSTTANRLLAAQILGVESEHRTLARVIANDLGLATVTGLSGSAEGVTPSGNAANNLAYERTFNSALQANIANVVTALTPFLSSSASHSVMTNLGTAVAGAPSAGQTLVAVNVSTTS